MARRKLSGAVRSLCIVPAKNVEISVVRRRFLLGCASDMPASMEACFMGIPFKRPSSPCYLGFGLNAACFTKSNHRSPWEMLAAYANHTMASRKLGQLWDL